MRRIILLTFILITSSCSELMGIKVLNRDSNEKIKTVQIDKDSTQVEKPAKKEVKKVDPITPVYQKKVKPKLSKAIKNYCKIVDEKFYKYGWGKSHCQTYNWHHVRNSYLGRPLIWVAYGNEKEHRIKPKNVTMIFCTVHGDEISPTKFCFDIMKDLDKRTRRKDLQEYYKEKLIVVAPLVSPDSFFKKHPTRTNHRKVDVNRNFPTRDWKRRAIKLWKNRYRSDPRRNPGKRPLSEQETIFQVNLIKRYKPSKLISVHAPLTIIDYDGPKDAKLKHDHISTGKTANQLLIRMSKDASGYRIKDYPFFPGSLGNWAGNERKIPTYTLELPTSDNREHKKYWNQFKMAIRSAVDHDLTEDYNVANRDKEEPEEPKKSL